jgi:hypothetical protein
VLHEAGIRVAGIIVNTSENSVEHEDAIRTIRALSPYPCPVVSLPRNAALCLSDAALADAARHPAYADFFSLGLSL